MMARAEQDAVLLRAPERPSLFGHLQDDGRGDGDPAGVDRHVYGRDLAALDADGPLYRAGGTVDRDDMAAGGEAGHRHRGRARFAAIDEDANAFRLGLDG